MRPVKLNAHNVVLIILIAALGMKTLSMAARSRLGTAPVVGETLHFLTTAA